MYLVRTLIFLLIVVSQSTAAATWYARRSIDDTGRLLIYGASNGTSYADAWSGCAAISGIAPGDTVELDSKETWYERCAITTSGTASAFITFRGTGGGVVRFEHTMSIDDSASFAGTYIWAPTGFPWTQVPGTNVWKKELNSYPYQATEDSKLLTGVNCFSDDEATAIQKLTQGTFCKRNTIPNLFYYRPTLGVPSDHHVRVSAHNDDAQIGLFFIDKAKYLTINGLSLRYHRINSDALPNRGALAMLSPDFINLSNIEARYNFDGISIDSGTNIRIASSVNSSNNLGSGITAEGYTDASTTGLTNITISATTNYNGRTLQYNTNNGYEPNTDGDGVGIGYRGGYGKNIRIVGANSCYNGSPDSSTDDGGSGIAVSTADANAGFEVHVLRSKLCYNHGPAFSAGDDWRFGDFVGNRVFENCRGGCIPYPQALIFRNTSPHYQPSTIANNEIWNNYGSQAIYLFNNALANTFSIKNNIIRNTSTGFGVSNFNAELFIGLSIDNVIESGNIIRSKVTIKAIRRGPNTFSEAQIDDGSWAQVSPRLGSGTSISDPPWAGGNNPNNE